MPSTTVRQYYLQGTGGNNTCTSLGQNISGNLSFEYIVQGNGSGGYIIGFGMSPDSGWGGSEQADLRCFSAGGGVYYDWGSFRRQRDSSPNMSAFYGHKMKIEGSKLGVKCTDLETNTVLFNWSVSASGTPSGPLMLCTTNNVRFYEGKVWKDGTLLLDYAVDEYGLKERISDTRPSVSNVSLQYEDVTIESWPDETPQQDNVLAGKAPTVLLFRRRILPVISRFMRLSYVEFPRGKACYVEVPIWYGTSSSTSLILDITMLSPATGESFLAGFVNSNIDGNYSTYGTSGNNIYYQRKESAQSTFKRIYLTLPINRRIVLKDNLASNGLWFEIYDSPGIDIDQYPMAGNPSYVSKLGDPIYSGSTGTSGGYNFNPPIRIGSNQNTYASSFRYYGCGFTSCHYSALNAWSQTVRLYPYYDREREEPCLMLLDPPTGINPAYTGGTVFYFQGETPTFA